MAQIQYNIERKFTKQCGCNAAELNYPDDLIHKDVPGSCPEACVVVHCIKPYHDHGKISAGKIDDAAKSFEILKMSLRL